MCDGANRCIGFRELHLGFGLVTAFGSFCCGIGERRFLEIGDRVRRCRNTREGVLHGVRQFGLSLDAAVVSRHRTCRCHHRGGSSESRLRHLACNQVGIAGALHKLRAKGQGDFLACGDGLGTLLEFQHLLAELELFCGEFLDLVCKICRLLFVFGALIGQLTKLLLDALGLLNQFFHGIHKSPQMFWIRSKIACSSF